MVKEFKVGTIFELGRVLLRCTKGSDCTKCYFFDKGSSCTVFTSEIVGSCDSAERNDHEQVSFERVGEVCDNSEEDS